MKNTRIYFVPILEKSNSQSRSRDLKFERSRNLKFEQSESVTYNAASLSRLGIYRRGPWLKSQLQRNKPVCVGQFQKLRMMFSQMNSCARRFQRNYMEEQFPEPGAPINFYQMNPQVWAFQQGSQDNNLQFHEFPVNPDSYRTSSDFRSLPGNETRFQETCVQESEAVDELIQILVECLKKADITTREVLLRKFFVEIEKETAMEGYIVERIKHSKINVLSDSLERTPSCSRDKDRIPFGDIYNVGGISTESATREVDGSSGEGMSTKLGRFKVKTVQFGQVVKEEAK